MPRVDRSGIHVLLEHHKTRGKRKKVNIWIKENLKKKRVTA
jgi:hypothetical protein